MKRFLKINIFIGIILGSLGGCGKKAPLDPPEGEVSTYPMNYPKYATGIDPEETLENLDQQSLEEWSMEPLPETLGTTDNDDVL